MPTPAMRGGDFSQAISIRTTGSRFPGNAIPASRMASQSTAAAEVLSAAEFSESAGYNYQIPLGEHHPFRTTRRDA